MKRCTKCGEDKTVEEFHHDRSRPDGRMSRCAACCRQEANERYAANPASKAAYYQANRARIVRKNRQRRRAAAKRKNGTNR